MSYGGCTANSCTTCIDQSDDANFQTCYWDNDDGYCYNWFDDHNTHDGAVSSKISCQSVYVPVILAVVAFFILFIGCLRRRQRRRRRVVNGNLYPAMLQNNPPPCAAQPNVIVANPAPIQDAQYTHAAPPQQYVQYAEPTYPVQQQYVAPVMNEAAPPPAYQSNVVIVADESQQEGAYTHQ